MSEKVLIYLREIPPDRLLGRMCPDNYEEKFKDFIKFLCDQAKSGSGGSTVLITSPEVLGDNLAEMTESLYRLSETKLSLTIADEDSEDVVAGSGKISDCAYGDSYKEKFKGLFEIPGQAKKMKATVVVIDCPEILGDSREEMVMSLHLISRAHLSLAVVKK